jgi:hypothetical protein
MKAFGGGAIYERQVLRLLLATAAALVALVALFAPRPSAGSPARPGRGYFLVGGTARERAEVRVALEASAFDWYLVPARITIHIARIPHSYSTPGEIWIDRRTLAAGDQAWGIVQHEYAHQVDFFLLDDRMRARLARLLGAEVWWHDGEPRAHALYGCERFASTFALAYWPSSRNIVRRFPGGEAVLSARRGLRVVIAGVIGHAVANRPA